MFLRRRLAAAGLLLAVLFGGYAMVAGVGRADQDAAAAETVAPSPTVPTQAPGPVDCTVTRCIALTFDDGPVPQTREVVDFLASRGVRATFYVVGRRASQYPLIIERAAKAGHEIGNHSWSHRDLRRMAVPAALKELERTADAVDAATGVRPATMRPPFGAAQEPAAAAAGLPQILWSVDTRDWADLDAAAVVRRVLDEVQPGGVVLMHDIHATTRAAVPEIVDTLLEEGYALVTVSELLGTDLAAGRVYRAGPAPKPTAERAS